MHSASLLQLPADKMHSVHDVSRPSRSSCEPVERMWATALGLVALCAAVAFTLPV